jgi:hypothetical protein
LPVVVAATAAGAAPRAQAAPVDPQLAPAGGVSNAGKDDALRQLLSRTVLKLGGASQPFFLNWVGPNRPAKGVIPSRLTPGEHGGARLSLDFMPFADVLGEADARALTEQMQFTLDTDLIKVKAQERADPFDDERLGVRILMVLAQKSIATFPGIISAMNQAQRMRPGCAEGVVVFSDSGFGCTGVSSPQASGTTLSFVDLLGQTSWGIFNGVRPEAPPAAPAPPPSGPATEDTAALRASMLTSLAAISAFNRIDATPGEFGLTVSLTDSFCGDAETSGTPAPRTEPAAATLKRACSQLAGKTKRSCSITFARATPAVAMSQVFEQSINASMPTIVTLASAHARKVQSNEERLPLGAQLTFASEAMVAMRPADKPIGGFQLPFDQYELKPCGAEFTPEELARVTHLRINATEP